MTAITAFIAEDHMLVLEGSCHLLEQPDLRVVGDDERDDAVSKEHSIRCPLQQC